MTPGDLIANAANAANPRGHGAIGEAGFHRGKQKIPSQAPLTGPHAKAPTSGR